MPVTESFKKKYFAGNIFFHKDLQLRMCNLSNTKLLKKLKISKNLSVR